ncbi:hypothetical protein A2881_01870 [Candidatus Peribacteria bacterium RIFCSPHIGHO2_01_FULL_55_13]|nr:MAG: hypothetical protein A2881_01870 [Candidatus Peribacteria bacterium RIFCSPHIGHO2_01_FULL_55_13]OGJ64530.1 MAG: hypothetical protein A3F36_00880 [Candidatus Peribacteria bacterium RIFCSPHIGHO2_12_FULL_55_11]
MKIRQINFLPKFHKNWDALPKEAQIKARKTIEFFRADPFHPSLRLHPLRGNLRKYWSISVDRKCRIILRIEGDIANFYSIGSHAIYEKM